jgi:hypothetical protein
MKRIATNTLVTILLVFTLLSFPIPTTHSQDAEPPMAPALRAPEDFRPAPSNLSTLSSLDVQEDVQGDGLKAVAIVGEVGGSTDHYRSDMAKAVDALRSHGVTVETFYYGERAFDWRDIVPALTGADFLLYMGHGVWWSGPCANPDLVGGFYLGDDGDNDETDISFVHPDQVRSDLTGRMAEDAVVIFSHVCYSAGDATCSGAPADWPSQAEAEAFVRTYAAPFVDVGIEAYFANNYFQSAADIVDELLANDPVSTGEIFKTVYPFDADEFRDLDYPDDPAYDLWLSGTAGNWDDGFVGMPDYFFSSGAAPQLGPLPDTVTFTHYLSDSSFFPATYTLVPENVGTDDPLTWEVVGSGDWFTVTPTTGGTSASSAGQSGGFTITPTDADGVSAAGHTGTVTVSVTNPEGTMDAVQTIEVTLQTMRGAPNLVYLPLIMSR